MLELKIKSSFDNSLQPSLFYKAEGKQPLLVGLHTWSYDRFNQVDAMLPIAEKENWHLLLPEFRGPNTPQNPNRTLSCGSPAAIQDILDSIEYAKNNYDVDEKAIYLLGGSGGAHMTLMTASNSPKLFAAAAAFCPITDIAQWYREKKALSAKYADDIYACCLNKLPEEAPDEYALRSPVSYIDGLSKANVKIYHGKFDKSVPYTHSTAIYNMVMNKYPNSRTFLEIFDGGHDALFNRAVIWFKEQSKGITEAGNTVITG